MFPPFFISFLHPEYLENRGFLFFLDFHLFLTGGIAMLISIPGRISFSFPFGRLRTMQTNVPPGKAASPASRHGQEKTGLALCVCNVVQHQLLQTPSLENRAIHRQPLQSPRQAKTMQDQDQSQGLGLLAMSSTAKPKRGKWTRTRTQCLGPNRNHHSQVTLEIGIKQNQHRRPPGQRDLAICRWRGRIFAESIDGFL